MEKHLISDDHTPRRHPPGKRSGWFWPARLQVKNNFLQARGWFFPGDLLLVTIGGIILAEVIAMIAVYFVRDLPYAGQVALDAAIMAAIITPWLYYLTYKPLLEQIQQRQQSDHILRTRLRLIEYAQAHTVDELLQFALDELETLTGSSIGFFHYLEADQQTLQLQAWSTRTLDKMCTAEGKDSHYHVDRAGVWADAVRRRQPVIHNDYAALPDRKGMPEGHAQVIREIVVPILRNNEVKAVLGLGNKPKDYHEGDLEIVSTLADFAWDVVAQKLAEDAFHLSDLKLRTMAEWTYDWETWLDPQGEIYYTSPSCKRITGYDPEEFIADSDLLARIVHPDDQPMYQMHRKVNHPDATDPVTIEYRVISKDGDVHWLEHICRPLFGPDQRYLGRRISDRDITVRKQAEQKIVEQNQREIVLNRTIRTLQTDIARDLHDTLGQNIGYLHMNLEFLANNAWDDLTVPKNQIQNMTKVARESYELIRNQLAILHSGNFADLISLFSRYAAQVSERTPFKKNITSQGQPRQLTAYQTRQLFYIFREALSNIEKYACADQVDITYLWEEDGLVFTVSDNGAGFDPGAVPATGHYGLNIMHERAELLKGSFVIQSAPGQGTAVKVTVPYDTAPVKYSK